jgi:hypothetical protein
MYTAGPLIPEPSPFKPKIAIVKLERYKSPGTDQILEEMRYMNLVILFEVGNNCNSRTL